MTDPRETSCRLSPKYDANGLITAVITDVTSGDVLMVAHMNSEALALTIADRVATFWSRSRQRIWKKGESSGHILHVVEMRIDCDQDAVWIKAQPAGPTCHTGAASCFYRLIDGDALYSHDVASPP